ncbi:MAG TPA: IS701 family transposase [Actinocrinis sp.]|nr:IS701 family transposase [Actinocrinis sp.]
MKETTIATSTGPGDALSDYCGLIFSSLARSDQRKWAEVYVRGLLTTPGRKTLAAISELVLGRRAIQPLQQFVNQSTWDHDAVRGSLGALAASAIRPRAWAIEETVFAKNGEHSVGVARQYVPSAGRTVNCQLALVLALVGDDTDVPVDWRLMLPEGWDRDPARRRKAHLPEDVLHRPRGQHILDLVDEVIEGWHLPPAPLLIDGTAVADVEPLLAGLESRGLGYIIEVAPGTVVRHATGPGSSGGGRSLTASQCVQNAAHRTERVTIAWNEGADNWSRQSQFVTVPVPGLGIGVGPGMGGSGHLPARTAVQRLRLMMAEWPAGRTRARNYWVTNLSGRSPAQLVALAKLRSRTRAMVGGLHTDVGLSDFEGRSFRGWHHHVTLVGAAAGFQSVALRTDIAALSSTARPPILPAA